MSDTPSTVQLYIGAELARYGFGEGHPFGPDRLDAFWQETIRQGLDTKVSIGKAKGTKLNLPMRPGANDADFLKVWPEAEAFISAFKPEFIIFQCSADSIKCDPITDMAFTPKSHAHAAASLCNIADEFSRGRIIALGGGGYNRANLAAAWNAVLKEMVG